MVPGGHSRSPGALLRSDGPSVLTGSLGRLSLGPDSGSAPPGPHCRHPRWGRVPSASLAVEETACPGARGTRGERTDPARPTPGA